MKKGGFDMKTISIDNYIFRIVTRDCTYEDGNGGKVEYKKGHIFRLAISDKSSGAWQKFLEENSRVADKQESQELFDLQYSNAAIGPSGYICHYFIPTVKIKTILDIEEHGIDTIGIDIGENGKYISTDFDDLWEAGDEILKISRRATKEETEKINDERIKQWKIQQEQYRQAEIAKAEAKKARYEANKSNSKYYPGACGNYEQVLVNAREVESLKLYDLYTIKQFYNELINSGKIEANLLKQIILYGGTVPYIMSDTKEETRKFGDVDIFIPVENMAMFREAIMGRSYFKTTYDSIDLTRAAKLTVAGISGPRFVRPLFFGEGDEAYRRYEIRTAKLEEEAKRHIVYQDYGFKGNLFGVNISVFPIYQYSKDGVQDICAKSFRVGLEEGDNKFLLNTVVTHNTPITSFSTLVEMCGGIIKAARLEYTIASKRSAINHGYKLRKDTDLADLEFMEQHSDRLGIDDSLIKHYEKSIPDYGIAKVYRITRDREVSALTPEEYRDLATSNHKPS